MPGRRGVPPPHRVEGAAADDGDEVAEEDQRQDPPDHHALFNPERLGVVHRERDGAFTGATRHDRNAHVEDRAPETDADEPPHPTTDDKGDDGERLPPPSPLRGVPSEVRLSARVAGRPTVGAQRSHRRLHYPSVSRQLPILKAEIASTRCISLLTIIMASSTPIPGLPEQAKGRVASATLVLSRADWSVSVQLPPR